MYFILSQTQRIFVAVTKEEEKREIFTFKMLGSNLQIDLIFENLLIDLYRYVYVQYVQYL